MMRVVVVVVMVVMMNMMVMQSVPTGPSTIKLSLNINITLDLRQPGWGLPPYHQMTGIVGSSETTVCLG